MCTPATQQLGVYPIIYDLLGGEAPMHVVSSSDIVPMIEAGESRADKIIEAIRKTVKPLPADIDCLILGCTHYPVWLSYFWELYPAWTIVDPGRICVEAVKQRVKDT